MTLKRSSKSSVAVAVLEPSQKQSTHLALPYQGKLTLSLLQQVPVGAFIVSMCCHSHGGSIFARQVGTSVERHATWTAIRDAGASQRNCIVTMDSRVAEIMAPPFPTDPEERVRNLELRSKTLSAQHANMGGA